MMQPVALTLVVLAFAGLNPLATTNWIEIYPVPTPPEALVYVEKTGICASEDRIISQLPAVFQIHREAVLRFITELGERYDQLLNVKFRIVSNKGLAHVIFRVKHLEPPIIGQTLIGDALPLEVEIDCRLASYPDFYMQAIILHELYHTLGIGHIRNDVSGDLMGGPIAGVSRPVYPTTLTLYAIYLRYFGGLSNAKTSIQLPSSIPYVQSRPFNETIESLSQSLSWYTTAYETLVTTMKNDITFLQDKTYALGLRLNKTESIVSNMSSALAGMSGRLSTAESQLNNLGGEVSSLKEGQRSISESLSGIKASLDRSGREIELLRGSLTALSTELEKQSRMITILSLVVLVLSAAVPAVAVYFRRRGGGETLQSHPSHILGDRSRNIHAPCSWDFIHILLYVVNFLYEANALR
ncbi:MAG: hypothetical protein QW580_03505 [Nitrososphaerota archaeon]